VAVVFVGYGLVSGISKKVRGARRKTTHAPGKVEAPHKGKGRHTGGSTAIKLAGEKKTGLNRDGTQPQENRTSRGQKYVWQRGYT